MVINICSDFTDTPGARHRNEGAFSGEEFRETILEPKFQEAKNKHEKITIELDGGFGYPTSFLEESFGGLARIFAIDDVLNTLTFVSNDEPTLIDEIKAYIIHARDPATLSRIKPKGNGG